MLDFSDDPVPGRPGENLAIVGRRRLLDFQEWQAHLFKVATATFQLDPAELWFDYRPTPSVNFKSGPDDRLVYRLYAHPMRFGRPGENLLDGESR